MPTRSGRYSFRWSQCHYEFQYRKTYYVYESQPLTIFEDIRTQFNNLGQRMYRIEDDRSDGGRQSNPRREDRVPRNHDRRKDDDRYQKNIKLDVSNFDGRVDP